MIRKNKPVDPLLPVSERIIATTVENEGYKLLIDHTTHQQLLIENTRTGEFEVWERFDDCRIRQGFYHYIRHNGHKYFYCGSGDIYGYTNDTSRLFVEKTRMREAYVFFTDGASPTAFESTGSKGKKVGRKA